MRCHLFLLVAFSIAVSACTAAPPADESKVAGDEQQPGAGNATLPLWMTAQLKDVSTGASFSIADFRGKPVFVESFAVWCPLCTRQQLEIKRLHADVGDAIVSVSLDTDPNENEDNVKQHVQKNGFSWHYAVSPTEVTNSLIEDFSISVTNVPVTPVILVCPDQSFSRLRNGIKSAEELKSLVNGSCAA